MRNFQTYSLLIIISFLIIFIYRLVRIRVVRQKIIILKVTELVVLLVSILILLQIELGFIGEAFAFISIIVVSIIILILTMVLLIKKRSVVKFIIVLMIMGASLSVSYKIAGLVNDCHIRKNYIAREELKAAVYAYYKNNNSYPPDQCALIPHYLTKIPNVHIGLSGGSFEYRTVDNRKNFFIKYCDNDFPCKEYRSLSKEWVTLK